MYAHRISLRFLSYMFAHKMRRELWRSSASVSDMATFKKVVPPKPKPLAYAFATETTRHGKRRTVLEPIAHAGPAKQQRTAFQRQGDAPDEEPIPADFDGIDPWAPLHQIEEPRRTGPEEYLRTYVAERPNILRMVLQSRGPPPVSTCSMCHSGLTQHFRCTTCFGSPSYCKTCLVSSHQRHPFHSVEEWSGEYFQRTTLGQQDYVLELQHACHVCSLQEDTVPEAAISMTVVSTSGVHQLSVRPCGCNIPLYNQLIQAQLLPATFVRPQTVFTFEVMEHYVIDYTICKTTAHSFYDKLRRLTNPSNPAAVPVSELVLVTLDPC
jgi:hypothetical protein